MSLLLITKAGVAQPTVPRQGKLPSPPQGSLSFSSLFFLWSSAACLLWQGLLVVDERPFSCVRLGQIPSGGVLARIAGNLSRERKFLPRGFHRVGREASKWTGNQTTRVLARGSILWFPLAAQLLSTSKAGLPRSLGFHPLALMQLVM